MEVWTGWPGVIVLTETLYGVNSTASAREKPSIPNLEAQYALSSLPPLVATADRAATLVFLAEALKPKATGKGTSTAEMSTNGVWSERDPREATAAQGQRATDAFVDAAVRFIERWKQLRPLQRQ